MEQSLQREQFGLGTSFYGIISVCILGLAIVGFSYSYFSPLVSGSFAHTNPFIHYHAAVATMWLVIYVIQTHLIANQFRQLHMKLGILGVGVAIAFVTTGVATMVHAAQYAVQSGNPELLAIQEVLQIAPTTDLTAFSLFVGFALYYRKRAQNHKRLMYLASCVFVPPSMFRFVQWWTDGPPQGAEAMWVPAIATLFIIAGPIYDKVTEGKVHKIYWAALPYWVLMFFGIPVSQATGFWAPVVHWIGNL